MIWKTRARPRGYVPKNGVQKIEQPIQAPPFDGVYIPEVHMNKLPTYIDMVEIRNLDVEDTKGTDKFLEGEDKWIWIKTDDGAWDGPNRDWRSSHMTKYFQYLTKNRVVITAGANQGMYVRFFAKKFETVYAFEPDPLNFHCMVINNQLDNVVKMQCALGEKNGWCRVNRNGTNNTGTWTITSEDNTKPEFANLRIPMISIDSLNFSIVDLIQLDVEGFEHNIIIGAMETIKRCQPVISLENGHKEEILALMKSLNYKKVDQSVSDTIFIPED